MNFGLTLSGVVGESKTKELIITIGGDGRAAGDAGTRGRLQHWRHHHL